MSADTVIAPALVDAETGVGASDCSAPAVASLPEDQIECAQRPAPPPFLHSPPDSYNAPKSEASDSELSDLEDESILDHPPVRSVEPPVDKPGSERQPSERRREQQEEEAEVDIGEVLPDHWSGAVPVFRPTMFQFKDFQRFMKKVDGYGMKSGIIKIIPPREWKDAQPPLDELVKHVRVREPIKQDIMGSNGTYRQVNILHGRSYNLPQWRQLCEQSEHQPPARRGERRINADKARPARRPPAPKSSAKPSTPKKRGRGRPSKGRGKHARADDEDRPMTPVSPKPDTNPHDAPNRPVDSIEKDPDHPMADDGGHDNDDDDDDDGPRPSVGRMGISRPAKAKMQSVSARRKCARREGSAKIDEAAFKDFDYRMDVSDYTPERCEELERAYWRTLTYASPLYGADMMGTLFDDRTESWGLNRLPNLLDVLGTKIPGVNTAYLYLGMWKATFAWHLEDVDLYSINYLHFGAPKQWYSISQADARRFEAAMKNIWPADAKACSQFLRHKGFLISPQHLLTHYNIKVNKVLSYPGEFVVTYPYGYHSGYNLGYNCAEAVNFALDSWLEMGKIAKKCECAQAQDSVWINVYEIERKLRGEETEYEETDDDDDDNDEDPSGLPTPPASLGVKFKGAGRKRKRGPVKGAKVKKIKLRLRAKAEPPCCLCPHGVEELEMLPTDHGRQAHRLCALYIPETYIDTVDGKEVVCNVAGIQKGRTDLKCLFCRSKRGACFQCSHSKCTRAYHATCAAAIGCFVEEQQVPIFGDDGTEYKEQAFAFSCRFHRTKRDKRRDGDALEADEAIRAAARALRKGDIRQFQFYKGEIFAGVVVENRPDEETVLIRAMPNGGRVEVEWKWLLLPDPADFRLPKASAKAVPLPASKKAKDKLNAKRLHEDKPRKDDVFVDGCAWAEFHVAEVANKDQSKVDLSKPDQIWHYLGRTSTDARAQYTDDPANACHNVKSNFLDTLPKAPKPKPAVKAAAFHRRRPSVAGGYSYTFSPLSTQPGDGSARPPKPYLYKPRTSMHPQPIVPLAYQAQGVGSAAPTTSSAPLAPPSYMAASQQNLHHRHHTTAPAHESRDMYSVQKPGSNNAQGYSLAALQNSHHAAAPIAQGRTAQPTSTWQPAPSAYQQPAAPQQRPAWHVYSSVHQKYPFFQVNHNRDPSKYRTPYSPWGGFVNGYERNPRAPMVSTQTDGLRKCSTGHAAPLAQPHAVSGPRYPPPHRELEAASQPLASQGLMRPGFGQQSFVMSEMAGQQPRPVMMAPHAPQYTPQHGSLPRHGLAAHGPPQPQAPKARPRPKPAQTPAPKPYKVGLSAAIHLALNSTKPPIQVPAKQSPVPLPPGFLAAMGSASATSPLATTTAAPATTTPATATPAMAAPAMATPEMTIPAMATPAMAAPAMAIPAMAIPAMAIPAMANPANAELEKATPQVQVHAQELDLSLAPAEVRAQGPTQTQGQGPTQAQAQAQAQLPSHPGASLSPRMAASVPVVKSTTPVPVPIFPGMAVQASATSVIPKREDQPLVGPGPTAAAAQPKPMATDAAAQPQEFAGVPGCESMNFVERMMGNLKRASQRDAVHEGGA